MKNRIFLGGTCGGSTWRSTLEKSVKVDMFNPIVEDWTEECQQIEIDEKENKCNIHLYVITFLMTGVFSIAEAIDSTHNSTKTTILHIVPDGFSDFQLKSLKATVELVQSRGGIAYIDDDLSRTVKLLNGAFNASGITFVDENNE